MENLVNPPGSFLKHDAHIRMNKLINNKSNRKEMIRTIGPYFNHHWHCSFQYTIFNFIFWAVISLNASNPSDIYISQKQIVFFTGYLSCKNDLTFYTSSDFYLFWSCLLLFNGGILTCTQGLTKFLANWF